MPRSIVSRSDMVRESAESLEDERLPPRVNKRKRTSRNSDHF